MPLAGPVSALSAVGWLARRWLVPSSAALAQATEIWDLVAALEVDLGDQGRILVRASGTEPVIRVMVEAAEEAVADAIAAQLVAAVVASLDVER